MSHNTRAGGRANTHSYGVEVHYEDTDMAGIVYYANYLKFIERARSDWVRGLGIDQLRMKDEAGTVFAVRRIEADFLLPARFGEALAVETTLETATSARAVLDQTVRRAADGEVLFSARVTLVAIGPKGRAVRLPAALRQPA